MQQLECVTFLLSYNDFLTATFPYDNFSGKSDANRTDVTWNNFNIGEMLKDYGDYEYFNLRLSNITIQNLAVNLNVTYVLSGFDFVHQSYNVQYKSELLEVPLCSIIESGDYQGQFQNLNHTIRFKRVNLIV